eukprot:TRINITY_DN15712_c0_g1_i5.p1 TRINITY_DN15712_c0_g1~~TRINITY_DN15712_c0_g1_i5.p1  ORF type:complete len:338 (-),score=89.79 TRINITY_DN15712_c0_g1_i5:23-1036(-)
MDCDLSLGSFLKAARPEWKPAQLAAVEEKLEKVGVRDLVELVHALRGRSDKSLNNRLRAVGEKCFTTETLSAFRQHVRKEPALRRAAEQRVANARLKAAAAVRNEEVASQAELDGLAAPFWNPSSAAQKQRQFGSGGHASTQGNTWEGRSALSIPTSKEEMKQALLDLNVAVPPQCQARVLRSMLMEARRLHALSRADLLAEVRGRIGLVAAAAAAQKSESLVGRLLQASFPDSLHGKHGTMDDCCLEASSADEDHDVEEDANEDDGFTFEILTPRPEPLSLSTLLSSSKEDLLGQCRAKSLEVENLEFQRKGVLALLLKMASRREYLSSLQASQEM